MNIGGLPKSEFKIRRFHGLRRLNLTTNGRELTRIKKGFTRPLDNVNRYLLAADENGFMQRFLNQITDGSQYESSISIREHARF